MRKGDVLFANFICTFGRDAGFLDYEEITLRAFTNDTYVRQYGETAYHLYEVKLVQLGSENGIPTVAVTGHFVKNTHLSREQLFSAEHGLRPDSATIASSPSAYFVLILNNHKLIYMGETQHAPSLRTFKATTENFIRRSWDEWIRDNASGRKENSQKSLKKRVPKPVVDVVALAERGAITAFIERFSIITGLRFRLIRPNHEIDASAAVTALRERLGPTLPERLDVNASSSVGLEKDEVRGVVEEATAGGNTEIRMTGKGHEGERLTGENEEFALSSQLNDFGNDDEAKRDRLYELFTAQVVKGKIKLGQLANHTVDKVRSLAALL